MSYLVAPASLPQVKVGEAVAMVCQGACSAGAPTVNLTPLLQAPALAALVTPRQSSTDSESASGHRHPGLAEARQARRQQWCRGSGGERPPRAPAVI
jgi:hypothetical protein